MKAIIALAATLLLTLPAHAIEKCRPNQPNTADKHCVVDGDTLWLDGVNIRLRDFDTPEPMTNICGGEREKALAEQASKRLIELLNNNQWTIDAKAEETGAFGRLLGTIRIDGVDVGDILIEERLARRWPDGDEWWCE